MAAEGTGRIDAVVIGRNEGARLAAAIDSLAGAVRRVVYVDSGSTDGSLDLAGARGALAVALDPDQPFTAARARNAGLALLKDEEPEFVLFLDGDTRLCPGFLDAARATFAAHPRAVVVCGHRREVAPRASVYNRLADREWQGPPGPARACGGDALMRHDAVAAVGGFDPTLIAGEEPDLCLRLRAQGGEVWRIDAEMTLHDAAMMCLSQWWRRQRRAGHAFAEGWMRHGYQHWGHETLRALAWGAALPVAVLALGLAHPAGWMLALAWPLQVARLARGEGWQVAFFLTLGKIAEAQGALGAMADRLRGRRRGLIEYR